MDMNATFFMRNDDNTDKKFTIALADGKTILASSKQISKRGEGSNKFSENLWQKFDEGQICFVCPSLDKTGQLLITFLKYNQNKLWIFIDYSICLSFSFFKWLLALKLKIHVWILLDKHYTIIYEDWVLESSENISS